MRTSTSISPRARYRSLLLLAGLGVLALAMSTRLLGQLENSLFVFLRFDLLVALYLLVKYGLAYTCFLLAAWCLMTAVLGRGATFADVGVVGCSYRRSGRWFLVWTTGGIVGSALCILAGQHLWTSVLNRQHVPTAVPDWGTADLLAHMPLTFLAQVLSICVLAPIGEEVLFRGFLYRSLTRRCAPIVAVLVSALIFTVAHLEHAGAAQYFLLGVACALLLRYTSSVWPGVGLHTMMNALFLLSVLSH